MMSKSRKKALLGVLALAAILPFQNCTRFEPFRHGKEDFSSQQATVSYDLLNTPEQTKALEILRSNCKTCHVDSALGGVTNILSVDHLVNAKLIVVGKPDDSKLFVAVNNNRMPQGGSLSAADKDALRVWILQLGNQAANTTPIDLKFDVKVPVEPISFRARLGKLSVLAQSPDDASLAKLKSDRLFLGDYDFANAILPKVSWEATDMKAWIEAVDPVCSSGAMRARYPWPSGASAFLQATIGRGPDALDNAIIQEISASAAIPAGEKFDVFCMSVISSKEYTAK